MFGVRVRVCSVTVATSRPRFTGICRENAGTTGVRQDCDTPASRKRLVGKQARDIEQFLEGVCTDDASLMEQSIDDGVIGRQGSGVGRSCSGARLGTSRLDGNDWLHAADAPRDLTELLDSRSSPDTAG